MSTALRVRVSGDFAAGSRIARGVAACWTEVSNAGGAVGFPFPPVDPQEMNDALQTLAAEVSAGGVRLFIAEDGREIVGWVALRLNSSQLTHHWASIERLQSRPDRRGEGIGTMLLGEVYSYARSMGMEQLRLVLRGGEGLEGYYEQTGWLEIGRHPGALRLKPGDDRDEVFMMLDLMSIQP